MTSGNVSDEPIAYRDDDALERLAAIADAVPRPRPRRSRPAPTTRSCASCERAPGGRCRCAARAATCPGALRLPVRRAAAAARVRGRAEEHVLRGRGHARLGRPSHRRPRALRDAALPSARASRTSSGCSRSRPRSSPTICTPTTSRPSTRSSATTWSWSASSTTTPTSPPAWPSTARRGAGRRRDLRRHRLRPRRHGLGRRAARRRPARLRARRHLRPVRMPGGDGAVRQPWRMACAWLTPPRRTAGPAAAGPLSGQVSAERWEAIAPPVRQRAVAADVEHRPAVRRGRGAVRLRAEVSYEGQAAVELEALAWIGRARRLRDRAGRPLAREELGRARPAAGGRSTAVGELRAGVAPAAIVRRAFTTGSRRQRSRRARRSPAAGARHRRSCRAACSRTGCCSSRPPGACASGLRVLAPDCCRPTTAGSATGRRRSRPHASPAPSNALGCRPRARTGRTCRYRSDRRLTERALEPLAHVSAPALLDVPEAARPPARSPRSRRTSRRSRSRAG